MPTHFNVGSQTVRGKVRPVVAWTIAGRKHRRFFTSKDAARGWAANQTEERAEVGGLFDALPPHERGELVAVWHEAQQLGATLRQCLDHWRATRIEESVCLRVAIDRLVAAKRIANRRASYVENMETYLRAFARGREEMRLESISQTDVETWLAVAKNASSRATRLGRLAALFAFAVRRGWLLRSPCARIERVSVEHAPPVILSVPECREFLTATRRLAPHALAFAVLGLFAGVRPEELGRVTWADVDLERGFLEIGAAASKVRRRRLVPLSANCVAWLRLRRGDLPLVKTTWRYARDKVCAACGLAWHTDVLRHTAASMMLARDQDAAKVALVLGHSPAVLFTHYRELVRPEAAAEFWQIMPATRATKKPSRVATA